jgi:hypothetical protein
LTSTGTIVRGATITPAGQHVMELTDDGHIELDGQLFDFGDAPCPRTVAQKSTAKRAVGEPTATAAPPEQPSQQDLPPAPEEEDGDSGTPFFPTREDCFPPCDSELPCPLPEPREFDDPCNVYLSGDGARQRFRA